MGYALEIWEMVHWYTFNFLILLHDYVETNKCYFRKPVNTVVWDLKFLM